MPLSRRQKIVLGLVVLALTATTGALIQGLSSSPPGQRVPALDGVAVVGWRNETVALVWEQPGDGEVVYFFVNVHTGERTALPPLPPLPKGESRDSGVQERYERSGPELSPDGQWLLYKETHDWVRRDSMGDAYRWRLVHLTNGTARLWPPDGTFHRTPHPEQDNQTKVPLMGAPHDAALKTAWFPNSQGWAEFEERDGKSCSLTYYPVSSLTPSALPGPASLDGYTYRELLPSGQGVFLPSQINPPELQNPRGINLRLLPLLPGSPPEERLSLPVPQGTDIYGFIDADKTTLLVLTDTMTKGLSRWLSTLLQLDMPPPRSALWRLPKNGSAPQCVREFGVDVGQLILAPGGKRLYYWPRRQRRDDAEPAYAIDLP
jgi:hypothetical protein